MRNYLYWISYCQNVGVRKIITLFVPRAESQSISKLITNTSSSECVKQFPIRIILRWSSILETNWICHQIIYYYVCSGTAEKERKNTGTATGNVPPEGNQDTVGAHTHIHTYIYNSIRLPFLVDRPQGELLLLYHRTRFVSFVLLVLLGTIWTWTLQFIHYANDLWP